MITTNFENIAKRMNVPILSVLSIGGTVIASHAYDAYLQKSLSDMQKGLSEDQVAFLKSHKGEIKLMYKNKISYGKWAFIGRGCSKMTLEHPDLPGFVLKIPHEINDFCYKATDKKDFDLHHTNLVKIRNLTAIFDRIVLPESYLYSTSKNRYIIEQRLDFSDHSTVPDNSDKQKALDQLTLFKKVTGLCDLYFRPDNPNVGFIPHTNPPKIGIIDFDCVTPPYPWEVSAFENRNQDGVRICSVGICALAGLSLVAKKVAKMNSKKIFLIGIALGGLAAVDNAFQDSFLQPASAMQVAGQLMISVSVVSTAALTAFSMMKYSFRACSKAVNMIKCW